MARGPRFFNGAPVRMVPELLLSSVDVQAPVRSVPAMDMTLPAGCVLGRSTSGQSESQAYLQRSARCPQSSRALLSQLRISLLHQGWHVRTSTDTGLLVERAGAEGFINLSSNEGDLATWITWLRIENRP